MLEHFRTIEEVRSEALTCRRCDLCCPRTQVVFGEGPVPARLMLVGEGPGADEDRIGRPFVGRAGKLLDDVLARAGIRREDAWVTNIVRCRPTRATRAGVRNRAPRAHQIRACDLWMTQELRFVSPSAIVCLGAVSAGALISRGVRIAESRGRWLVAGDGIPAIATYHPAYLLRLGGANREAAESRMLDDLRAASARLRGGDY